MECRTGRHLTLDLDQRSRLRAMNTSHTSMTIGAVARRVGVAIDTIRYYEREGLLPEPLRRASGYRSYDEGAVRQLRFIRRAKDLGFTLEEIRDLLALSADRHRGVKAVKKRAEERLAAIDERIAELTRVRDGLEQLIEACPGHGSPDQCPILKALTDQEDEA
jgi:MerR family copper efflux transcriptional regulator